jgi:membrane associated rhomboid family serine protease
MSQPSGGVNPVLQFYQQWSEKTPYLSRSITIFILICYVSSFFFSAETYIGNTPIFTIGNFEFYRCIFSPFVGNSFLNVLLILLTFPTMASKMEWSLGSIAFLYLVGTISILTNIIFDTFAYIMYFAGTPEALLWSCQGFWSVLFGLITIECMQVTLGVLFFV